MLHLWVYGPSDSVTEVGEGLEDHGAARRVAFAQGVPAGQLLLTAEVHPDSADAVLEYLLSAGLEREDIALARFDEVGPVASGHPVASLIWADVLGQARKNARPVARYLVFMMAAGVIAGFGVIEVNSILIVGAMAVSPDLLPLTAACVGLVSRRARLAGHALAHPWAWASRSPRSRPRRTSVWPSPSGSRARRGAPWPFSESTSSCCWWAGH